MGNVRHFFAEPEAVVRFDENSTRVQKHNNVVKERTGKVPREGKVNSRLMKLRKTSCAKFADSLL